MASWNYPVDIRQATTSKHSASLYGLDISLILMMQFQGHGHGCLRAYFYASRLHHGDNKVSVVRIVTHDIYTLSDAGDGYMPWLLHLPIHVSMNIPPYLVCVMMMGKCHDFLFCPQWSETNWVDWTDVRTRGRRKLSLWVMLARRLPWLCVCGGICSREGLPAGLCIPRWFMMLCLCVCMLAHVCM